VRKIRETDRCSGVRPEHVNSRGLSYVETVVQSLRTIQETYRCSGGKPGRVEMEDRSKGRPRVGLEDDPRDIPAVG
jgi:hypothetical protein